ncbi:MAG: hypothetical protein A3K19_11190 [Lentisphaerae bacterium RIFOXYB12_FULL_65_16]|nr:MAG: hypothetical protein A3K18_24035 [Lentisphaerae bacterium RIFOXYA12_64_32]OGV90747.1 MAG: hypothetical protein A3K19_11190 [Lentisphaerae bacterium RIFOXYB12_FULL_65_16]
MINSITDLLSFLERMQRIVPPVLAKFYRVTKPGLTEADIVRVEGGLRVVLPSRFRVLVKQYSLSWLEVDFIAFHPGKRGVDNYADQILTTNQAYALAPVLKDAGMVMFGTADDAPLCVSCGTPDFAADGIYVFYSDLHRFVEVADDIEQLLVMVGSIAELRRSWDRTASEFTGEAVRLIQNLRPAGGAKPFWESRCTL